MAVHLAIVMGTVWFVFFVLNAIQSKLDHFSNKSCTAARCQKLLVLFVEVEGAEVDRVDITIKQYMKQYWRTT